MKKNIIALFTCVFIAFLASGIGAQEPVGPDCDNVFADAGHPKDNKPMDETADPVVLANGNLSSDETDFMIQTKGLIPLEITRTYNSQSPSDLEDWQPERGAGTWKVLDGVYTGHGDRSVSNAVYGAFTLSARMKTITAGTDEPWMTARVNFRYSRAEGGPLNTYYVLIDQNHRLEFAKVINNVYDVQSKQTSYNPFEWNTVKVEADYSTIKVYVNGNLEFNVSSDLRLQNGQIALEACFSHCHFDDIVITPSGQPAKTYDFNNPDTDEPLGMNWTHTYGMSLKERAPGNVTITGPDGGRTTYIKEEASYISPKGVYSVLAKDGSGFTLREKDGTIYRFDLNGRLSYIEDRFGNRNTLYYENISGKERLKSVTDSSNRSLVFAYTAEGRISSITDPKGNRYQYIYNGNQLVQVTDPRGSSKRYEYHPVEKVRTKYTSREGHQYEYSYSPYNLKVKTQKDPEGNYTTFDYFWAVTHVTNRYNETWYYRFFQDSNLLDDITDNIGSVTDKWWNENNQLMRVKDEYGRETVYEDETHKYDEKGNGTYVKDPMASETFFRYDPAYSLVEWKKDARGNETNYVYDASGKLLRIEEPMSKVTRMEYYDCGKLKKMTDAVGNITEYEYDANGCCAKIKYHTAGGIEEKAFVYDIIGNLTSETDEEGNKTNYTYDANNNLTEVRDGNNNLLVSYTYDKNDNLKSMTDALGHAVYYQYDWVGNLVKTTEYDENNVEHSAEYTYDNADYLHLGISRLLSVKDRNGNITTYQYSNLYKDGVLKTVTDAEGRQAKYKYDLVGNMIYIEDAAGKRTNFGYYHNDQLRLVTYPDNSTEEYFYNPLGQLDNKRDRKWKTTTFGYDALNRLSYKTYPDSSQIQYAYNLIGNVTTVISPNGTISMSYDERSRLLSVAYPAGKSVSYEYYKNGLREKLTYPDSAYIAYHYDSLKRLTDIKDPSGASIAHYAYDKLSGRRYSLAYMNGTYIEYGYDVLSRVKSLKNKLGGGVEFSSFSYTYDKAGNRLSMASKEGLHRYYYDKTYQLIDVTYPDLRQSHYQYDVMGNRLYIDEKGEHLDYTLKAGGLNQYDYISKTKHNIDIEGDVTGSSQVSVNGVDAIVSEGGFLAEDVTLNSGNNLILADGGVVSESISLNLDTSNKKTFTYDANGSLTQVKFRDKTVTYTYDYENRLSTVIASPPEAGEAISYTYDYLGRRISKTVTSNQSTETRNYIYDGDNIIAEYDSNGTLVAKYIYGPNIDEPIRLERGGQICYYHFDALGSITDLSNSSGSHIEHYYYDPFGNTRIYDPATGLKRAASSYSNFYMFTGRQWDGESGLYYYRARMYDPNLGKFLQADPVGYEADINLYRYCGNNGINLVDPLGLEYIYLNAKRAGGSIGAAGSTKSGWGHSWITAVDSQGNKTSYGFWPDEPAGKESITGKDYTGVVESASGDIDYPLMGDYKADSKRGFEISKQQYDKLMKFLKVYEEYTPYWSLNNNCTDFAIEAARRAGIVIPSQSAILTQNSTGVCSKSILSCNTF